MVSALRPQQVAICGDHDGVATFAISQALDKLNISSTCHAFGMWRQPDQDRPRVQPPARLKDHAMMLYDDMVRFHVCGDAGEAFAQIATRRADLVYIDLLNLGNEDTPDCARWLECLTDHGVLLMHGSQDAAGKRLWTDQLKNIADRNDLLEVSLGDGLVAVTKSGSWPPELRELVDVSSNAEGFEKRTHLLNRLGQGIGAVAGQTALQNKLTKLTTAFDAAQMTTRSAQEELEQLRQAYDERTQQFSQLQSLSCETDDREAEIGSLQEERLSLKAQAEDYKSQCEALQAELEDARAERETLRDALREAERAGTQREADVTRLRAESEMATSQLEMERTTRFEETALLTRTLETARIEVEKIRKEKQDAEDRVSDFLSSTSWRVTAPIRKLKLALRG
ncbi:class I SAM-dependent methyltransferase [Tritonibacter scottomollicae]|uniref:class I SAM-dependent methyltransferase n=1 Tax=Tritonibacter scottomollicae TaxID=483013 RepID=UPI003AA9966A